MNSEIAYPSKELLDRVAEKIENKKNFTLVVNSGLRQRMIEEILPILISNKIQKDGVIKRMFRMFYLSHFLAVFGMAMEKNNYYISYNVNKKMEVLFEWRET